MEDLRPSERVYRTPELYQTILDFVSKDGIARMSPPCRDFQLWVGKFLYRHMRLGCLVDMLRKRKSWTEEYCARVLYVDANQMDEHLPWDDDYIDVDPITYKSHYILSGPALRYIQQKCPKLRSIYQNNNYWDHRSRWNVKFGSGGRITVFQTRDAHFWLDRELVRGSVVEEDPLPGRDMAGIDEVITLGLSDGFRDSRRGLREAIPDGMKRYREWLVRADDLPANLIRLHLVDMPISLDEVTEMCANRAKHGGRNMEEIRVDSLPPFDLASFEHFLDETGQYVRILILSHIQNQNPQTPLLRLTQLSRVVDLVKQKCPVLERLELYFSGAPGGGITLDETIPISTSPYDGTLHFVGFHLHDDHSREYMGDTPLFALARNMACLGGQGCYYVSRLIDPDEEYGRSVNGNSEQLASLVTYLQQLPSHTANRMRSATFKDLDLAGPRWKQLLDLEYESDGRPIKITVSQLRSVYLLILAAIEVLKRVSGQLLQRWSEYGIYGMDEAKSIQKTKREWREQSEILETNLTSTEQLMAHLGIALDFEGRSSRLADKISEQWARLPSMGTPRTRTSRLIFFGSILPGWPGCDTWPPSFLYRDGKPHFRSLRLAFRYRQGVYPEEVPGLSVTGMKDWEEEPDEDSHYMWIVRTSGLLR